MKWITHQTGAILLATGLQLPWVGVAAAAAGAILPDVVDQRISGLGATRKQKQKIFNRIHRGNSHWFGWWLALALAALFAPLQPLVRDLMAGLAFGSLSHVLLDMMTTRGVPLLPFTVKNKFSLHLCSTGKLSEYIFLAAMFVCGVYFYKEEIISYLSGNF